MIHDDGATGAPNPSAAWDADHFHVSALRTYLTCPRQYLFRHVMAIRPDEVPFGALVGTSYHAVLSHWHAVDRRLDGAEVSTMFRHDLEARVIAALNAGKEVSGYDVEAMARVCGEAATICAGYTSDPRNALPLRCNETRFRVNVQGGATAYPFAGTIDQVRELPDGTLQLVDLKSGSMKPQDLLLDLDFQLSLYALAMQKGELETVGDIATTWAPLGRAPDAIAIVHLRDYLTYEKNQYAPFVTSDEYEINPDTGRKRKKRVPNPRFDEGYKAGERKGPVFYRTQRSAFALAQAEKDLSRVCAAIRFKMFFRRPAAQGACVGFCRFVAECTADRSEPL